MTTALHRLENNAILSGKTSSGGGGGTVAPPATGPNISEVTRNELDGRFGNIYTFTVDGNRVEVSIVGRGTVDDPREVSFDVNGLFRSLGLSTEVGNAIALRVSSVFRQDVSNSPDGTMYATSAFRSDALGTSRTVLYARAGFSLPIRFGGHQYGMSRNGRLIPTDRFGVPLSASRQRSRRRRIRELSRFAIRERRGNGNPANRDREISNILLS